jgi:predicted metal-binding membrane protein
MIGGEQAAAAAVEPLPKRERALILAALLALAAAGWAVLVWQQQTADDEAMGLTMGMAAPVFMAAWLAMMVAMMFPTAAPMILTFARVYRGRRERGGLYVPTAVFVAPYLLIWVSAGLLAYAAAAGAERLADHWGWAMEHAAAFGGALIVLAGLYQLSPLKGVCLAKCRTPFQFIMLSWRDGYGGAVRMGLEHGLFCLGCCWLLFALLFPLGVMNVAVMALITGLIFAEKSLAVGPEAGRVAAVLLVGYGALVIAWPGLLPVT